MSRSATRVLVVDAEQAIRRLLKQALSRAGFEVHEAAGGLAGVEAAGRIRPEMVTLEWELPDMAGLEFIRRLREWSEVPIVVVSATDQVATKVAALEAGADDYVTKPFSVAELLARLRVVLRRMLREVPEAVYRTGDLAVDLMRRRVLVRGQEVRLTPTEYDLLCLLVRNAGKVLTHAQIIAKMWGPSGKEQPHTVRVNVSNLRHKLEPEPACPRFILTESGVGYRLKDGYEPSDREAEKIGYGASVPSSN